MEIASKVEGDVEVFARHGDVRVGKLRCVRAWVLAVSITVYLSQL